MSFALEFWLSRRQIAHIRGARGEVPEAFAASISLAAHHKAADYTIAKEKLGQINGIISLILLLLLTLGGGITCVFGLWQSAGLSPFTADLATVASLFLLLHLLDIPSSLYSTFVLEAKFGFNKSTLARFAKDQAITLALTAAIGLPILLLLVWIMDSIGEFWWLYAWGVLIGISVAMSWLYPTVIAPLFNKFTPMPDGDLKTLIRTLLARCGFSDNGIFIMDGSKRSGHGNAYFTGFGKNKRIVFYDTLVDSLSNTQLEAVLAHELGHFKCRHVLKMLLSSSVVMLAGFFVFGWLISEEWFFNGLGVASHSNAIALFLFMLVSPTFTIFMQPISAYFQRKFEFEADNFACQHADAGEMISALVRLYEENASTLTPDPLYSAFHYSHPPAAIRIANIQAQQT